MFTLTQPSMQYLPNAKLSDRQVRGLGLTFSKLAHLAKKS